MDKITIVQGDTPRLDFTITDADGNPIDLGSITTIRFKMGKYGEETGKVTKTCSLTNPGGSDGECYVQLTASDTNEVGDYYAEVELQYGSGGIISTPKFLVAISDEVADPVLDTPVIAALVSPNVTGDYRVQWDTIDNATTYVLEEDSGSGWSQIYSGSDTYYDVTGKTDGSYFYRVKAQASGYTDSEYSETQSVTVDIP